MPSSLKEQKPIVNEQGYKSSFSQIQTLKFCFRSAKAREKSLRHNSGIFVPGQIIDGVSLSNNAYGLRFSYGFCHSVGSLRVAKLRWPCNILYFRLFY